MHNLTLSNSCVIGDGLIYIRFSPIEMPPKKKKVDRAPIASTSDRREDVVRFAMKVWSPLADVTFPPGFRRSVRCCLLMAGHQESPTALIGKEVCYLNCKIASGKSPLPY